MCYNEAYRCKIKTDLHHHYINADLTLLAEAACQFICTYKRSFLWWGAFSSKRLFIKLPWGWLFIKPSQGWLIHQMNESFLRVFHERATSLNSCKGSFSLNHQVHRISCQMCSTLWAFQNCKQISSGIWATFD